MLELVEYTLRFLLNGVMGAVAIAIVLWISGAIYFDLGRGKVWGWILTAVWLVGVYLLFNGTADGMATVLYC